MSKTTSILCNHSLDVSSIENLAKDLAYRLNETIEYGYDKTWYVTENKELEYDYDFVSLGIVIIVNSTKKYMLLDCTLGAKKFIATNGIDILETSTILYDEYQKEDILEEMSATEFELNEVSEYDTDLIAYIYKTTLDLWKIDCLNWHYFKRKFINYCDSDDLEFINSWRTSNKEWVTLFGGNYMFVYCDEENSYQIQEILETHTLEDKVDVIQQTFKNKLVNVSRYFLEKAFLNKPIYVREAATTEFSMNYLYAIEQNISFFPVNVDYPILFYDDFKDLDSNFNPTSYFDFIYNSEHIAVQESENTQFQNDFKIIRKEEKLPDLSAYFSLYKTFVTGYKYFQSTNLTINLIKNQEVFLVREPQNEYDKHAIALYIDFKDKDGEIDRIKIGFIPKEENYILSKLLDNQIPLKAFLIYINEKELYQNSHNYALKIEVFMRKHLDKKY